MARLLSQIRDMPKTNIISTMFEMFPFHTPHDRRRTSAPDMNSNGVHQLPNHAIPFFVFVDTLMLSVLALWRLFSCAPASCVCKSRIPSRYTRRYSRRQGEVMHPSSQPIRDSATCHGIRRVWKGSSKGVDDGLEEGVTFPSVAWSVLRVWQCSEDVF